MSPNAPNRSDAEPVTHRAHVRSPVDVLRLIGAALVIVVGLGVANVFDSAFLGLSEDGRTAIEDLPAWVSDVPATALAVAVLSAAVASLAWMLATTRFRRFTLLVVGFASGAALSLALGELVFAMVDASVQDAFRVDAPILRYRRGGGNVHPGDPLLAGAAAMVGLSSSYLRRTEARRLGALLGLYAVASLIATGVPALGVVMDIGAGLFVASALLLLSGRHDLAPDATEIRDALGAIGVRVASIDRLDADARASAPWVATTETGERVFVKALGRDERSADLMFRAYRWIRLRKTGDHRPFVSLRRLVEHEALVSLQAAALGVRTPKILGVATAGIDGMVLAYEAIEGASADTLDDIDDDALESIWSMVSRLHANRIAHRDLRLANILLDTEGRPWLIDFGFSELAASDQLLGTDAAELLASTAAVVGAERAVAAAHRATGLHELERTMPWLQPMALSSATRRAIDGGSGLAPVRRLLIDQCGVAEEEPVKLQRIDGKTLFIFVTIALSAWFLIPQIADVGDIWAEVKGASLGWALAAVAFSMLTYVAATASLLGAIPVRLRFGPALAAQMASSFANRVTPAKVGGIATNIRYFQRQGIPAAVGGTAVGLNAVAGVVVHVMLTMAFLVLSSSSGSTGGLGMPSTGTVGLAVAIAGGAVVLALSLPLTRRLIAAHVVPQLRSGLDSIRSLAKSPARLGLLFGGSAAITMSYLAAMTASLEAFGSTASFPLVGLLFLTGSAVATAAPTPGGLGAAEAALIAALSTIEETVIVVPAVFLYRFVTFWLPILPGWVALTYLRRTDRI